MGHKCFLFLLPWFLMFHVLCKRCFFKLFLGNMDAWEEQKNTLINMVILAHMLTHLTPFLYRYTQTQLVQYKKHIICQIFDLPHTYGLKWIQMNKNVCWKVLFCVLFLHVFMWYHLNGMLVMQVVLDH